MELPSELKSEIMTITEVTEKLEETIGGNNSDEHNNTTTDFDKSKETVFPGLFDSEAIHSERSNSITSSMEKLPPFEQSKFKSQKDRKTSISFALAMTAKKEDELE